MPLSERLAKENESYWTLVYLGLKFASKTVNSVTIPAWLKEKSFAWAEFALSTVGQTADPSLREGNGKDWNCLEKGTIEFYYFHAIKWAMKFLQKFINLVLRRVPMAAS
jgi:hypothetical protein